MKHEQTFLKAIMAGVYIGMAGLIYLSINQHIIGALFFSFGLLVILSRGYYLYTGKVGYVFPYQKGYINVLAKTLSGNVIGIFVIARLFRLSGITHVIERGTDLYHTKLGLIWYETLILAIFSGMLMYIAVDSYRKAKIDALKIILVVMPVAIFVIAKFEHSIANMLYLFLGNTYTLKGFLYLLIMLVGNAIGSITLQMVEIKLENHNI